MSHSGYTPTGPYKPWPKHEVTIRSPKDLRRTPHILNRDKYFERNPRTYLNLSRYQLFTPESQLPYSHPLDNKRELENYESSLAVDDMYYRDECINNFEDFCTPSEEPKRKRHIRRGKRKKLPNNSYFRIDALSLKKRVWNRVPREHYVTVKYSDVPATLLVTSFNYLFRLDIQQTYFFSALIFAESLCTKHAQDCGIFSVSKSDSDTILYKVDVKQNMTLRYTSNCISKLCMYARLRVFYKAELTVYQFFICTFTKEMLLSCVNVYIFKLRSSHFKVCQSAEITSTSPFAELVFEIQLLPASLLCCQLIAESKSDEGKLTPMILYDERRCSRKSQENICPNEINTTGNRRQCSEILPKPDFILNVQIPLSRGSRQHYDKGFPKQHGCVQAINLFAEVATNKNLVEEENDVGETDQISSLVLQSRSESLSSTLLQSDQFREMITQCTQTNTSVLEVHDNEPVTVDSVSKKNIYNGIPSELRKTLIKTSRSTERYIRRKIIEKEDRVKYILRKDSVKLHELTEKFRDLENRLKCKYSFNFQCLSMEHIFDLLGTLYSTKEKQKQIKKLFKEHKKQIKFEVNEFYRKELPRPETFGEKVCLFWKWISKTPIFSKPFIVGL